MRRDFAYILSAIRDGSIPICGIKKEVSLATDPSREWLEALAGIASKEFDLPLGRSRIYEVFDRKSKIPCFRLKVYSVSLYRRLSEFYEPGDQIAWKTPAAIRSEQIDVVKGYIAGFYDAEGGCRNVEKFRNGTTKTINYWASIRCKHVSENEPLCFLQEKLKGLGIGSNIYDNDELVITGKKNLKLFYRLIPLMHPRKKDELRKLIDYSEHVLPMHE
jgi:hypothetical protein